MAIIDTLRFRNILVNGKIAEEAPAEELVAALDDTFEEQFSGLTTKSDLALQTADIKVQLADIKVQLAEMKTQIATIETRMMRTMMWVGFGTLVLLGTLMTLLQIFID